MNEPSLITGSPAPRRVSRVLTYRKAAVISLLFPPAGIPAMYHSLKAGRLAKAGEVEPAREAGGKARDWSWYAVGVGLTVYVIAFLLFILFNNHGAVRVVFFGWSILTNGKAWHSMLKGFWINVQVFFITEIIVLVWALVVAIVRLLPGKACRPIRLLATLYVDIFRGIPAILVVYLVGLGFLQAKVPIVGDLSDIQYVILALTLTYGAYVSEVYRAGIESVHWSQVAAARSLGLSYTQALRHVVVPQAVRRVIPPLLNDFIGLQKDTAIISVIGVLDVVNRARFINNSKGTLAAYSLAALLFLAVTIPFTRWLEWLQKRSQNRMQGGH
ncbi:MAG: amino acid transporter rane protein family [Ilumatobacteraceae bacterium]|nr:amino acid transporter rane protein family [Ilumatobacteraceae bacterium]